MYKCTSQLLEDSDQRVLSRRPVRLCLRGGIGVRCQVSGIRCQVAYRPVAQVVHPTVELGDLSSDGADVRRAGGETVTTSCCTSHNHKNTQCLSTTMNVPITPVLKYLYVSMPGPVLGW